jgi:dolichyl-phosphate-mannose--protein O-mannosyl transferase
VIPSEITDEEVNYKVRYGDPIPLKHVPTLANLFSFDGMPSPITRQQEVSCYYDKKNSGGNVCDIWIVEKYDEDDEQYEDEVILLFFSDKVIHK